MYQKIKIIVIIILLFPISLFSQETKSELVQTIRGIVTDNASGVPLPYVSIGLLDKPSIGTSTDDKGQFSLNNVPIGRHTLQASFVGYESHIVYEIMVTSAKEVYLEIGLKESL